MSCRTDGGRKRKPVADSNGAGAAEVHDGEVAAEQDDTRPVADKRLIMSEIMIYPVWFC